MKQLKLTQTKEGPYKLDFDNMMELLTEIQPFLNIKLDALSAGIFQAILKNMMDGKLTYEQIKPTNMILGLFDIEVIT